MESLINIFKRLHDLEGLEHEIIALCAGKVDPHIIIEPDWIDGPTIAQVLALAREGEIAVSLTREGLRLEEHDSATVLGVEAVKQVLREDQE